MGEEFVQTVEGMLAGVDGLRASDVVSKGASDASVEAALAAAERLRRSADALSLSVIAELDRRGEEQGPDGLFRPRRLPVGKVAEMAPDVVMVAACASAGEAGRRCDLAARLSADLPQVLDLLASGSVTSRVVELVERETRDLDQATLGAVLDHLLAPVRGRPGSMRIADLEPREVARACRRVIARTEPGALTQRAARNRAERVRVRANPGPVGTTRVEALLPSEVAAAAMAAIEAAGAARRVDDPDLTKGAARALGFADLLLRGVEVTAHVRLGIPIITSAASRLSFAPTGGGERHPFGRFCTCEADPSECACFGRPTDVEAAFAPTGGGEPESGRVVDGEGADEVDVLLEEWSPGAQTQARTTLGPEGPLAWISGAWIPGIGYVPPDVVAALTTRLDTRVSRALLDARTGTLVETSTPAYRIPAAYRDFVTAREDTCRMFGCDRPVHTTRAGYGADLDHAEPWPHGTTSPGNLSALCRHHHRVKHAPRWSHRLHPDGTAAWTTPGGTPAFTYPDHHVHTDQAAIGAMDQEMTDQRAPEPFSPPSVGANEPELAAVAPPF